MTIVGLELFVALIATSLTSGRGNATILKAEVSRMQLLMYIARRGFQLGKDPDSMRVQDPCMGADSAYFDQYCSWITSMT